MNPWGLATRPGEHGARAEMRRERGRPRATRRGQVLVEMACVLPVAVLILVAIVDFGAFLMRCHEVQAAMAEGARLAVNRAASPDDVRRMVVATAGDSGITEADVKVTMSQGDGVFEPITDEQGHALDLAGAGATPLAYDIQVDAPHTWFAPAFWGSSQTRVMGRMRVLALKR